MSTTALAILFVLFTEQVKCVLLNACYSKTQAKAIARHINYVIGMSQAIVPVLNTIFAVKEAISPVSNVKVPILFSNGLYVGLLPLCH